MKKLSTEVRLVLAALLAVALMAVTAESNVGFRTVQDGVVTQGRLGHEAQVITAPAGGDLAEAVRLGQVYTVKTASAGTSLTTAGVSPLAAAGVAWLALYNPAGSGVNLEVEQVLIDEISGTPGVGVGVVYDLGCGQVITAAQNATPVNHLNLSAGAGFGYTQTALTGSTLLKEVRVSPYAPFAAAAAGVVNVSVVDNVNGALIIAPGCVLALQTTAAGTTHIAAGSITYRQAIP